MSSESTTAQWNQPETVDRPRFVDPNEVFEDVHELLGRKWHLRIIYYLLEDGPMGFSRLKGSLDGVSSKMLSESLSSLETAGLVAREIVNEQPVRVEYSLTERGAALQPIVDGLLRWDASYGAETTEALDD